MSKLRRLARAVGRIRPARVLVLGYSSYVLLGIVALSLPWASRGDVGFLDAVFTATSAVSTTGLAIVDTGSDFTFFGQLVILLLIQVGGIGYMTLGSFVVLTARRRMSSTRENIAREVFALPDGMRIARFIRHAIYYTVLVEAAGAWLLYLAFQDAGVDDAVWTSIFHSVSAFCTAGFSLYGDSLSAFRDHLGVNAVVAALSYAGALGFIVVTDVATMFVDHRRGVTLTTKVIVLGTLALSVLGALGIGLSMPREPGVGLGEHALVASFQAMTAITTVGFNTAPIDALPPATLTILVLVMAIGASPSGTGGGAKVTTLSVLLSVSRSALRGDGRITFWGHPIGLHRVSAAVGTVTIYLGLLFTSALVLFWTEAQAFEDLLFEATSALGTVGLSRGITGDLSVVGQLTIALTMFIGRVGPLTLATALIVGDPCAVGDLGAPDDVAV